MYILYIHVQVQNSKPTIGLTCLTYEIKRNKLDKIKRFCIKFLITYPMKHMGAWEQNLNHKENG